MTTRWTPYQPTQGDPARSDPAPSDPAPTPGSEPSTRATVRPVPMSELSVDDEDLLPNLLGRTAPVAGFLRPGTRMGGRYETIRPLSAGGMAEVHLARAIGIEGFEKLVVLKRILAEFADDPHYVEMFLGEARVAGMMNHPNIAQTFDLGREGSDYYYVMEFVDGIDLAHLLLASRDRGRDFGLGATLAVGIGVASGLQHAHERTDLRGNPQNIIHRDVSPANVLVTREGQVKLVDFGIAKAAAQKSVTRAGTRKGKLPYMSPEQLLGLEIDQRSDLYSLGILLYEASTMTRLFRGPSEVSIVQQVAESRVPAPSIRDPGFPRELEAVIMRCLARDPNDRFARAADLVVALEAAAMHAGIRATTTLLAEVMHSLFADRPIHVYPDL